MTSRILIFEGPDCSGKSILAREAAKLLRARYVHHGPYPNVKKGASRLFIDAAMPALLGYQDVVMDRSWLSEHIYGTVFRNGVDRIGPENKRMIERIMMRCATTVIRCDPGWEAVSSKWTARKELNSQSEYLDKLSQLSLVYKLYSVLETSLPLVTYNYNVHKGFGISDYNQMPQTTPHNVNIETAGSRGAGIMIVGESYAPLTDSDHPYQKPFTAFSGAGCSRWLTAQLIEAGVEEEELFWCNADHLELGLLEWQWHPGTRSPRRKTKIIALGVVAASRCRELGLKDVITVPHPQAHKRFNFNDTYPLQEALK